MKSNILSLEERNKVVEENINLIRHLVYNQLHLTSEDADDAIQIGCIGLIKAASTYDLSKKIKFSTYASRCALNEIYMAFRKEKRHSLVIKLEEAIKHHSDDDSSLIYMNILSTDDSRQYDILEQRENVERTINLILNCFDSLSKIVMLYQTSGMTQQKIAEMLGTSRSYISRILTKSRQRLSRYLEDTTISQKDNFKMSILSEEFFKITIKAEAVPNFNKALAKFFMKMGEEADTVPMFTITKRGEQIKILLIRDLKSFEFLGKMIQEIDEFYGIAKN